jgi:hypothetical protein
MAIYPETIGESLVDHLIYDSTFPVDTHAISLPSGDGLVKRGTVIAINDDDTLIWEDDDDDVASYILADDTDTGSAAGSTVVTLVYRTGKFTRQALAQTLTAAAEKQLEDAGIYLADIV